jgi:hypothetical protein
MRDWLKGIILMVVGNSMMTVLPVWLSQYLLTLPNPFYSIVSSFSPSLEVAKQAIGTGIIAYALYLIVRTFYRR